MTLRPRLWCQFVCRVSGMLQYLPDISAGLLVNVMGQIFQNLIHILGEVVYLMVPVPLLLLLLQELLCEFEYLFLLLVICQHVCQQLVLLTLLPGTC